MRQLIHILCDIDDVCTGFESTHDQLGEVNTRFWLRSGF